MQIKDQIKVFDKNIKKYRRVVFGQTKYILQPSILKITFYKNDKGENTIKSESKVCFDTEIITNYLQDSYIYILEKKDKTHSRLIEIFLNDLKELKSIALNSKITLLEKKYAKLYINK